MDRRESLKHILEAYRCNPTPEQLGAAIGGIEELFSGADKITEPLDVRKQRFVDSVRPYVEKYGRDTCNSFCKYWTEISPKGRKFRYEKERVFDVGRRLSTWSKNDKKFSILNALRK